MKDPHFDDFSVGCDKCMKWYHYTCQGLNGSEPEIQEGSSLPYYCNVCKLSLPESEDQTNIKSVVQKGKGKGRGKRSTRVDGQKSQKNDDSNPAPLRRSEHRHKPVDRSDYLT